MSELQDKMLSKSLKDGVRKAVEEYAIKTGLAPHTIELEWSILSGSIKGYKELECMAITNMEFKNIKIV